MTNRSRHFVPILDGGVTLDRGDHRIVVLDAVPVPVPAEQQRQIDAICALVLGGEERRSEEGGLAHGHRGVRQGAAG